MKFTRCATLGLSLIALLSGCAETETTVSVNVRYWTNFLDPSSFEVKIEQEGREPLSAALVPRELEEGKYDVVCDHNWELDYCRFYKRFELSGWSEKDTTVTFSGKTNDGTDIAAFVTAQGITDKLSDTFELQANEVNVVYIQLPNVNTPADPVSPDTSSDSSGSTSGESGLSDGGVAGDGGSTTTDGGATDAGVSDAGADAGNTSTDAGSTDGGATDAGATDASTPDSGAGDAATDAGSDAGDAAADAGT